MLLAARPSEPVGGDFLTLLTYAVRELVDGLREQLERICAQQRDVVGEDCVHDLFRANNSPTDARRRHLAMDLGKNDG